MLWFTWCLFACLLTPLKCLMVAMVGFSCIPLIRSMFMCAQRKGSSPPVSGLLPFLGSRQRSSAGPSCWCFPYAWNSFPITRPTSWASSRFHEAAIAIPVGNAVASTNRTPWGPSDTVNPGMLSSVLSSVDHMSWPCSCLIFSDKDIASIFSWMSCSRGFWAMLENPISKRALRINFILLNLYMGKIGLQLRDIHKGRWIC